MIRPTVDMVDPDATTTRRRLPSLPRPTHALVAAVTLVAVVGGAVFVTSTRSNLEVAGIVDGQRITRRDLATVTLRVTSAGAGAGDVGVEVNGQTVALTEDGDGFVVSAAALGEVIIEGENSLVVSRQGRLGIGGSTVERTFTFDPVGPLLMVPAAVLGTTPARPAFVRGLVDGAVALSANGQPVTLEPGGAFTVPVAPGATVDRSRRHRRQGQPRGGDHPGRRRTTAGRASAHCRRPCDGAQLGRSRGTRADPRVGPQRVDQRRATRHQGRERRGRLRHRCSPRHDRRGGPGALRRRRHLGRAPRSGCPGDRADRVLPRPRPRLLGMGERPRRDGRAAGLGRAAGDGLRRRGVHQRRRPAGPPVPDRPLGRGRSTRLRRDPLRLRTPAGRRHVGDVLPRAGRPTRCRRRSLRCRSQRRAG